MPRLLAVILVAVVLLAVLAAAVGHLAYGVAPVREGRLALAGLAAPVTLAWPDDGPVRVEATSEADLMAGLGYVHAADHAWAMALWRQATLGELAAWFPAREGLDRHARALGLAALARQTYAALPPAERALLDAYARGANLALAEASVAQRDEFVLLDVEPAPWEPWHSLAVERLVAWLGTPALAADTAFVAAARGDRALARFAAADQAFRAFLQLGGMEHSRAWAAPLGEGRSTFVQQHAWGASALPLLREVTLGLNGRRTLVATVPGTLAFPAGQDGRRAWSVFLTADLRVTPDDGPPPPPRFDRLVDRSGNEALLRTARDAGGLYLPAAPRTAPVSRPAPAPPADSARLPATPPASSPPTQPVPATRADTLTGATPLPPDSLPPPPPRKGWRIRWTGFSAGTDLGAWRALLAGRDPAFRLHRGDGLVISQSGEAAVLGDSPVRRELPGGVFVGGDALSGFAAERLAWLLDRAQADSTAAGRLSPDALTRDAYSPWAAGLGPRLVAALGPRRALGDSLGDAYAFLRGWDARYDPASIGASVFEAWLATLRRPGGALPPLGRLDSAATVARTALLRRALGQAVGGLSARHGRDAGGWRWEEVQPGALRFPVWALGDAREAPSRYAPVTPGPGGHPTTLLVGPALGRPGVPAPGVWTAWTEPDAPGRLVVRHPAVETSGFLARARSSRERMRPRVLRPDAPAGGVLVLEPAGR